MPVEISNESNYSCEEDSLLSLSHFAIKKMRLDPESDLGIRLVEMDEMKSLNGQWMGEIGPTDVLSFPIDEMRPGQTDPGVIGDIVLCPEYAEFNAQREGKSLDEELQLLTAHGFLHLLGYDHRNKPDEKAMFALQEEILREWRSLP
jgi:probable rRNA maturation factor